MSTTLARVFSPISLSEVLDSLTAAFRGKRCSVQKIKLCDDALIVILPRDSALPLTTALAALAPSAPAAPPTTMPASDGQPAKLLESFVQNRCELNNDAKLKTTDFANRFSAWYKQHNHPILKRGEIIRQLYKLYRVAWRLERISRFRDVVFSGFVPGGGPA